MLIERKPHVEQNLGRGAGVAKSRDYIQQETNQRDAGEKRDDNQQAVKIAPEQRAVEEVFRQIRDHQREAGADETEHQHQHQPPPVGDRVLD